MIEMLTVLVLGMVTGMSSPVMPYDYADNPVLELNQHVISWIPYDQTSKFDIIRNNVEIIKDTKSTSYKITKDGCYHIEDESRFRALDSNTVCLKDGEFTASKFVPNESPIVVYVDFDNSKFKTNMDPENKIRSIDTLEIVIRPTAKDLTYLNACNVGYGNEYDPISLACYDPNNHRIHISMETMGSLWHELQHAQGLEIPNHH